MLNYYDALKTYLALGDYVLADAEERIDKLWVEGKLTTEQRDELRAFAALLLAVELRTAALPAPELYTFL